MVSLYDHATSNWKSETTTAQTNHTIFQNKSANPILVQYGFKVPEKLTYLKQRLTILSGVRRYCEEFAFASYPV